MLGEPIALQLGEDQIAIDLDLKTATGTGVQFKVANLLFVGFEQGGRQTDGLGLVVSHGAVLNGNNHEVLLFSVRCSE